MLKFLSSARHDINSAMPVKTIVFILLMLPAPLFSQKKISADINASLLYSFGRDKTTEYTSAINPSFNFGYLSKEKFRYPYLSLMARIAYSILPQLQLGLQTGIYVHYAEGYPSPQRTAALSVPLQITSRYTIHNFTKNAIGVDLSGGIIFFDIKVRNYERYKNGNLYKAAVFYSINKESILRLGLDEQIDHVSQNVQFWNADFKPEIFKYTKKRTAVFISYGFIIK